MKDPYFTKGFMSRCRTVAIIAHCLAHDGNPFRQQHNFMTTKLVKDSDIPQLEHHNFLKHVICWGSGLKLMGWDEEEKHIVIDIQVT